MTDIEETASRAVARAIKLGVSHCDVLVADSKFISAEIEKGSIKQASVITDPGVAIRAFVRGSPGFAYCTGHNPSSVGKAVAYAVTMAKAGTKDPDFKDLPEKSKVRRVDGLFDSRIRLLEPDDAVAMVMEVADAAGTDRRVSSVNASVGFALGEVALANSNGFCSSQKMSSLDVVSEVVATSGAVMFSGYDAGSSRKLDRSMIDMVGRTAREHAIKGLKQTKIETGDYALILDPMAIGFVFSTAIGGGANADSVQRKRSYLADSCGKTIGAEAFSVIDDPTLEWATGSRSFDGEGVPSRKRVVVDHGVLRSYLYDSYSAGKDGIASTGNSSRGGSVWSYRHPPSISTSNMVIGKGDSSLEEMIEETKNGVYLRMTFDYPNLATGEFSGLMMESYSVRNGEVGPSIRQSTVGIGLLEMFKRIDMVGKKRTNAFGVLTPPLRISEARVGGSA